MPLSEAKPGSGLFKWAATAPGGSRLTYHVEANGFACDNPDPEVKAALADAKHLYDRGEVELVQKRQPNGELDYIMVKRRVKSWVRYDEFKRRQSAEALAGRQYHARRTPA